MTSPPVVTGLSPIEGPPGTRLTIRGENLGNSPNDVIGLTICGCDCLLSAEWKSPNKIIARSGPGKGRGDVIVTTRDGGLGTSTVQFRGYHETIGPMKESAVWIEEAPLLLIWGRRSLSPSSYQHEDPLGLSVEGNDKKFPEDDLHELFPNASGDIASENFSAEWFLLENHHATSFNDLKAGLSFLRRKVEGQKEGQLSFLKANVGSVMDQIDTLKSLKEKFEDDKQQFGSDPVLKLEKAIKESVHEANKLFDEVLSRRDRADATRSALNVLTRFRFLFCLPCAIDRNVKRGDFDIIINDYSRVKNLFNKTEVPVFRKALNEIEKRVLNLREMLHSKLKQMPISIEEQKRIIRYLVHLEADGEPAWDAISSHSDYITQRLKDCYEEHKTADNILAEELGKSRTFSNSKYSKYNVIQDPQQSVPQVVLFVEEVCDIMSTSFPDLWKLGQAYFSGELQVKVEAGRQAQFKHIVLSLMDTFCKTLRSSLLPLSFDKQADRQKYGIWSPMETDTFASWLPHCLQYVRSTYSIFIRLDLPSEALDIISDLIFELRLNCMIVLLKQANKQMSGLEKKETWKIEFASGHSGITELPLKFEKILHEVIQLISESVLITEQRESPLFDNPEARKNLDTQIDILLTNFRTTLTNLAYHYKNSDEEDHHSPAVSQLIGSSAIYRNSDKLNTIPIWEQRLLTTLSNCHYTSQVILPKIPELFSANGYPVPVTAIDSMRTALQQLDKSILDTYLEQKSDPLVGTIEPSMYLGRFDWDTNLKPVDIKPYAKECINNLIGVHTEVHRVSPVLVEKVLTEVVEIVAEELSRLMSCVKKFSHFGVLQARADIQALQETLKGFTTPKAKIFFDEAVDSIPKVQPPDQKLIDNIIKQFRVKMHLQILCFNNNLHSTNGSDQ